MLTMSSLHAQTADSNLAAHVEQNAAPDVAGNKQNTFSSSSESMNSGYLLQLVGGLLIVILCIVVLAWVARRFSRLQRSSDGRMEILGTLSMGARERVVLLRVGGQQLLLGVAPGRINTLRVIKPSGKTVNDGQVTFADTLQSISETNGMHEAQGFLKAGKS